MKQVLKDQLRAQMQRAREVSARLVAEQATKRAVAQSSKPQK